MDVIKTENLRKEFYLGIRRKQHVALESLTLQVSIGEIYGFLGPNGSGKTTTMKLLTGLCSPTAGQAWLLGKRIGDVAVKNEIGFLPEHPYFYDYLTADEFLKFYGSLFQKTGRSLGYRIDELLELVGLISYRTTRLKYFSKGMLQRIGIAQALINDPRLILLDEPMSGLDPVGRRTVRDIIVYLREQKKTVFFSSHILPDAEAICDRVAILMNGRLVARGPVKDLIGAISIQEIEVEFNDVNSQGVEEIKKLALNVRVKQNYVFVTVKDVEGVDALIRLGIVRGWKLQSVIPHRASLEDIFFREVRKAHDDVS